ncbi:MAG: M15 family metallopeptidase, partial [Treponema sp.]|nr:M15 family metallopeptidase [Treponema sp.]
IKTAYNEMYSDWILSFSNNETDYEFFWSDGRMLPKEEIPFKEKYWSLLYSYAKELKDPATMTEEEKERLKNFSSASNRKNGAGTPMFFFDAVYDSGSQKTLKKHIKSISFLGKTTRIHERIEKPLKKVETRILELSKTDKETKDFVDSIKSNDAYYWRLIAGTNRKSFHSLGIAIDILPVKITGEIYWSWAKDKNPEGWMLTPLSKRWLPPAKVIDIFEEEGFIFGGKWAIWDNMHFEYHPELIKFRDSK